MSILLGGNLAKSLLTRASLHWSPTRSTPSLSSQQKVFGVDTLIVELIELIDLLLESGKSESDSVVGVRVWPVVGKLIGFATDIVTIPRIEQTRSAIWCQVQVSVTGQFVQMLNEAQQKRDFQSHLVENCAYRLI